MLVRPGEVGNSANLSAAADEIVLLANSFTADMLKVLAEKLLHLVILRLFNDDTFVKKRITVQEEVDSPTRETLNNLLTTARKECVSSI